MQEINISWTSLQDSGAEKEMLVVNVLQYSTIKRKGERSTASDIKECYFYMLVTEEMQAS